MANRQIEYLRANFHHNQQQQNQHKDHGLRC